MPYYGEGGLDHYSKLLCTASKAFPAIQHGQLDVEMCTCNNRRIREVEAGGWVVQDQSRLCRVFRVSLGYTAQRLKAKAKPTQSGYSLLILLLLPESPKV